MNWDRMEGEWKQHRGKAVHQWGKVMNDNLAAIAGKYEELVGRLQERYGIAKEDTTKQVKDFKKTIGQLKKSNSRLIHMQKSLQKKEKLRIQRAAARKPLRKPIRRRSAA
jgi:uncharacterized protein YjbJ (UPF0337 family)